MRAHLLIASWLLFSATSLSAGWFGPDNYAECVSEAIDGKTGLSLKYALEGAKVRCFKEHCEGRLETIVVRTKEESMKCKAAEEKKSAEDPYADLFSDLVSDPCAETVPTFKDLTCP
jgi:hypothetical protein